MAYEHVNDLDLRARLRLHRGFCRHHAWQFVLEESDGLAVAIIYRDVVQNLIRPLEALGAPHWPVPVARLLGRESPELLAQLAPRGECPACRTRDEAAGRYLGGLAEHWLDPPLRAAWWHSAGLCLPHLRQALASPEMAGRADDLLYPTRERLERLAGQPDAVALVAFLAGRPGTQTHHPPEGALPPALAGQGAAPLGAGPSAVCPACARAEIAGAAASWDSLGTDGLGRLCQHHTWRTLAAAPVAPESVRRLAEATQARLARGELASPAADCPLCRAEAAAVARAGAGTICRLPAALRHRLCGDGGRARPPTAGGGAVDPLARAAR